MAQAQVPEVRWAQRSNESEHDKNVLYVTVVCPDIESPKINIEAKSLKVQGKDKHGKEYDLNLEFFAEVEAEATKQRHTGLNLFFIFQKKEDKAEFWPRLTSSKAKQHNIRTDFDKWVDEDEQEEALEMPDMGAGGGMGQPDLASMMGGGGGLDFSKLAGMEGMGGMQGLGSGDGNGQPDFAKMMADMQGSAPSAQAEGDSDDEEELPALSEVKDDK